MAHARDAAGRGPLGPLRTCTGCRKQRPKRELLRFTAHEERAVIDPLQRRAGRGVYLCPRPACIERAARKGGVARALRCRSEAAAPGELVEGLLEALGGAAAGLSAQALADGRARRTADGGAVVVAPRVAAALEALAAQIEELKRCRGARGEGSCQVDCTPGASGPRPRQGGTEGERSDL